jgi:hypothetical protein
MLDTLISSKNTFTYDTSKEIQEDACKAASCKNSKDIFIGIEFMGSSSQSAHDGL